MRAENWGWREDRGTVGTAGERILMREIDEGRAGGKGGRGIIKNPADNDNDDCTSTYKNTKTLTPRLANMQTYIYTYILTYIHRYIDT